MDARGAYINEYINEWMNAVNDRFDDAKHYTNGKSPPSFDQPYDANVTGVAMRQGDIVVVATDGLFDNVELEEVRKGRGRGGCVWVMILWV